MSKIYSESRKTGSNNQKADKTTSNKTQKPLKNKNFFCLFSQVLNRRYKRFIKYSLITAPKSSSPTIRSNIS